MCGITGVWFRDAHFDVNSALQKMNSQIIHRGPDAGGIWLSQAATGLGFGHRRLSILDLSTEGAQPKKSQSGRFVVTFNGEIYNFLELRRDLEKRGAEFKGHSDTEVILAGFELWGIKETLTRAVGMFALGVWDEETQVLTLARDRIGEKPLYYAATPVGFVFGSELRTLKVCPEFKWTISQDSIGWYLKYGYIPAPLSIFFEAKKLLPGTFIEIRDAGRSLSEPTAYWSAVDVFRSGDQNPFRGTFDEAVSRLEGVLENVVRNQMLSDVPLGAFLSGGVDSSTVVAIMQKHSTKSIKTFSIGFEDQAYNEAPHAAKVAKHLGTDHTELYVSGEDALAVVPKLATIFDEPFSDSSQIPTYLVAKLAKSQVTVALSGDGGDEVFAGYTRYQVSSKIFRYLRNLPSPALKLAGKTILKNSDLLSRLSGQRESRWAKLGSTLQSTCWTDTYERMITIWSASELLTNAAGSNLQNLRGLNELLPAMAKFDPIGAAQLLDLNTYLPDDIMVKVDRSAMAVSLESRAPFLDHRLIEFAASLPKEFKSRGSEGKRVLKELLYRHVPREMVDRPKMGFGIPIDQWLQGPLKDWVGDLLSDPVADAALGKNKGKILDEWRRYSKTQKGNKYGIWSAVILCDWLANSNK
jgi:asparagine synthase (glutamine-hydrolysing)